MQLLKNRHEITQSFNFIGDIIFNTNFGESSFCGGDKMTMAASIIHSGNSGL